MEKIIEIDDQLIILKSHAGVPIRYKQFFQTDFFSDVLKLSKSVENMGSEYGLDDLSYEQIDNLELEIVYRLVWLFAKMADKSIPPLAEWLEGFDDFPLEDIIPEITDMLTGLMKKKQKTKK